MKSTQSSTAPAGWSLADWASLCGISRTTFYNLPDHAKPASFKRRLDQLATALWIRRLARLRALLDEALDRPVRSGERDARFRQANRLLALLDRHLASEPQSSIASNGART